MRPEPKFFEVSQLRQPDASLEPTLAEIDCRMPSGHPYKDSRHVTWAHETTHGLNGRLRNQHVQLIGIKQGFTTQGIDTLGLPPGVEFDYRLPIPGPVINERIKLGHINACYCLAGRGWRHEEPSFKLNDIAQAVPQELRGMSYQLYLVQQQQYWNNEPLYVFDEWSAYLNGLSTALDHDDGGDGQFSDLLQAIEFMGYSYVLAEVAEDRSQIDNNVLDLICFQTMRTFELFEKAKGTRLRESRCEEHIKKVVAHATELAEKYMGLFFVNEILKQQPFWGLF